MLQLGKTSSGNDHERTAWAFSRTNETESQNAEILLSLNHGRDTIQAFPEAVHAPSGGPSMGIIATSVGVSVRLMGYGFLSVV